MKMPPVLKRALAAQTVLLCLLFASGSATAQTSNGNATAETITVTGARPVSRAMDAIEQRYGVLIDYVDPVYEAPQDIERVASRPGHIIPVPKVRTLTVQYAQLDQPPKNVPYLRCNPGVGCPVNSWPEGGITALIQKVLHQFAAEGGQVFGVRKLNMPYGPRWEVYPEQVRDQGGTFRYRPDVLSAIINIPEAKRTWGGMLGAICNQLTTSWGRKFGISMAPGDGFPPPLMETGADNITAEKALAQLMGQWLALRLNYAPDDGLYFVNVIGLPQRPMPRPPNPPPPKPPNLKPRDLPAFEWRGLALTPKGSMELQTALAKEGFLHTPPTAKWDANAKEAVRRLQAANGLPVTGELDSYTVAKLRPYLPKFVPPTPPAALTPNPLGFALFHWLQDTHAGRIDIQRALTQEGYYSGPLTGSMDAKTRAAMTAFQKANGLTPTGLFDDATSRKLSPLLLKMKN